MVYFVFLGSKEIKCNALQWSWERRPIRLEMRSNLAIFSEQPWVESYCLPPKTFNLLYLILNAHRWNVEFKICTNPRLALLRIYWSPRKQSAPLRNRADFCCNIMISSAAFNLPNIQLRSVVTFEFHQLLQIRWSPCRSRSVIFLKLFWHLECYKSF